MHGEKSIACFRFDWNTIRNNGIDCHVPIILFGSRENVIEGNQISVRHPQGHKRSNKDALLMDTARSVSEVPLPYVLKGQGRSAGSRSLATLGKQL